MVFDQLQCASTQAFQIKPNQIVLLRKNGADFEDQGFVVFLVDPLTKFVGFPMKRWGGVDPWNGSRPTLSRLWTMIAPARRVYQRIEVNRLGEVYHWLILRSGICTQIEIYINIYIYIYYSCWDNVCLLCLAFDLDYFAEQCIKRDHPNIHTGRWILATQRILFGKRRNNKGLWLKIAATFVAGFDVRMEKDPCTWS